VRRHKPKFWESMARFLEGSQGYELEMMVLTRIKHQLGYPEAARDFLTKRLGKTLLSHLQRYGMGEARPLTDYLKTVGLDMTRKEVTMTHWCETGRVPPGMEHYQQLYPIENYVEEEQARNIEKYWEKLRAEKHQKMEQEKVGLARLDQT
jgi:hypothetical protein